MGSLISKAFIDPNDLPGCFMNMTGVEEGEEGVVSCMSPFDDEGAFQSEWAWGLIQVLSLMSIYGYVLFYASNMLSEGSELLLLVPSLAGLVGSVVLPILGAVPDGAIMLFSGLGPNAQEQLVVGVGALAGSTIMLLTIPWGLSIYYGRVPIQRGTAVYGSKAKRTSAMGSDSGMGAFGVTPDGTIRTNSMLMIGTALIYLVIQGPAFAYAQESPENTPGVMDEVAGEEHWYALVGLVVALVAFFSYIWIMTIQSASGASSTSDYIITQVAVKAIDGGMPVTLAGIIAPIIESSVKSAEKRTEEGGLGSFSGHLLDDPGKAKLAMMLKPFFRRYDANNDGHMNVIELRSILTDLGEEVSANEAKDWMRRLDPDNTDSIEMDQFTDAMLNYIKEKTKQHLATPGSSPFGRDPPSSAPAPMASAAEDAEDDEDDEEEMPEEFAHLSPAAQQRMILRKAFGMMGFALALILVFSDPMVEVMSNVGERVGIPPFYVAFVLAPLASNASELIASLAYAGKKTRKTITVSLSALEGAACMNNTFCLAIFMALIYFKQLAWKFSAETIAILIVELLVALIAMAKTMRTWHAYLALSLFPGSIALVALLEAAGYD